MRGFRWLSDLDPVTLVILLAVFGVFALSGISLARSIDQGRESHQAWCAYKAEQERSYQASQEFLLMTPEQRQTRYGRALAHIPEATIKKGMADRKAILDSLDFLSC